MTNTPANYPWQQLDADLHFHSLSHDYAPVGLLEMVSPPPREVLDVGCFCGGSGQWLKKQFPGVRLTGIEMLDKAANIAREKYNTVILSKFEDVDTSGWHSKFDAIIAADVLEHIYNPWVALKRLKPLLTPRGAIYISLPNIRNLNILMGLAGGEWRYASAGILDVTHIRFFTKAQALEMLQQTGWAVSEMRVNPDPSLSNHFKDKDISQINCIKVGNITLEDLKIEDVIGLFALQFFIRATPLSNHDQSGKGFFSARSAMLNWFKKTPVVVKSAPESDAAAIEDDDSINQLAMSESEAFKNQGNAYLDNGKLEDAAQCFRQAIVHNPRYAEAYTNLGLVFQMQGNLDEAVVLYRKAVVFKPNLLPAHPNLGITLMNLGQVDAAEESFRRVIALAPEHPVALQSLGVIAAQRGDISQAETLLRLALELLPNFAEAHNNLGSLLHLTKRLPEAEASYRRAIKLQPDYVDAHTNLGKLLMETKRLSEAEVSYRRALELKPDYAEVHNSLGNLFAGVERQPEAEACYRRALELKPDYADAHYNLGSILSDLGRLVEAEASFRRTLQINPNFAEAHNNLGTTLHDLGRLVEAEASLRRVLQIKPDYADAHYNLGNILNDLGQLYAAEASFKQTLQIEPDHAGRRITTWAVSCKKRGSLMTLWRASAGYWRSNLITTGRIVIWYSLWI